MRLSQIQALATSRIITSAAEPTRIQPNLAICVRQSSAVNRHQAGQRHLGLGEDGHPPVRLLDRDRLKQFGGGPCQRLQRLKGQGLRRLRVEGKAGMTE
jgi:hypothetical protein